MQDLFSIIRNRRSIRKYQNKPVSQDLIEHILIAAGWAPSAHNAQPWRFIILTEHSAKKELAEAMAESWAIDMTKDGIKIEEEVRKVKVERFASAPVVILACITMEGMVKQPDTERQKVERDLAIQSLGAAIQNLLLTAHAKGLGACWFCAPTFCKETVRRVLKIPDEIEPQALIVIGYPAEKPSLPIRKTLEEYCFKDKWGHKLEP
jgi:coenzyme F420-0:L-glutamate ligase / coenzyme F420-1:gamma-L-glutamate ligase